MSMVWARLPTYVMYAKRFEAPFLGHLKPYLIGT